MGVTPREQQMIDLDDAGKSIAQIAAQLGVSRRYVDRRIKELNRGLGICDRHHEPMARGSKKLLRAIERARAA